jgi:ABC-2 type transport system permease protein
MTTTTHTTAPPRSARGRSVAVLATVTVSELRLLLRDPVNIGFSLLFPALLLTALGLLYPGFTESSADFGGLRPVDAYGPIAAVLSLLMLSFTTLPTAVTTYRERGILRRLSLTPLGPGRLLAAVLLVDLLVGVAGIALVLGVGRVVFAMALPRSPLWFVAALLLGATALLSFGLLIAAVSPRASVAVGLGQLTFFPAMFFAGVWFPREAMSGLILTLSDASPMGAFVQALGDSWRGDTPRMQDLGVMAVWAVIAALIAKRSFRWE